MKDMIIGAILVIFGLLIYWNIVEFKEYKAEQSGKIFFVEVDI